MCDKGYAFGGVFSFSRFGRKNDVDGENRTITMPKHTLSAPGNRVECVLVKRRGWSVCAGGRGDRRFVEKE